MIRRRITRRSRAATKKSSRSPGSTWLRSTTGTGTCTTKALSQSLGITSISRLVPQVKRVVLASPSDGINFVDGLKSAYGIDTSSFKSLQKVDYSIGFASVGSGSAQMCVGYTTDGWIEAQGFLFLSRQARQGSRSFTQRPSCA